MTLTNRHLIPSDFSSRDYLAEYYAHAEAIDSKYMLFDFASLKVVSDNLDTIKSLVTVACITNDYKWQNLYNTTKFEYNPIWNVDGEEVEEHEIAQRHTTNDFGESSGTSTNSQVPDDMTTEKEVNKNVSVREAYQDETTEDAYTDKITRTRGGNIGVTKTQELIRDEREINNFVFLDVVMKDIINAITYPMFEED